MSKRYYVMDLDETNLADLLDNVTATLVPAQRQDRMQLQGLVDEAAGGIVAYILPGFDFDTVRQLEFDGSED